MKKYRKCPRCNSEFVFWNWMHCKTFRTWWLNLIRGFSCAWKRPYVFIIHRWTHECWECTSCFETMFKVRNGISHDTLDKTYVYLPKHELRDMVSEVNYLFHDGYKILVREHCQDRLDKALNEIKRLVETRLNEKGIEPPNDIVSILERQIHEEKEQGTQSINS